MEKLLLHSCCGPCSTSVLERLIKDYDVTIFYYNPNIYPKEEYIHRRDEQIRVIKTIYPKVKFLEGEYNPNDYEDMVKNLQKEPEGGARCTVCFNMRLDKCAQTASLLGYDCFTTTLSVSPHKNADLLNKIGLEKSLKYNVSYICANFKKQNGYLRSIELSKQYEIYRQHYCGCKYSIYE